MKKPSSAQICVIGSGYVGTTNAIAFAEMGHDVIGYDISEQRVRDLACGVPPYHEAGLEERLRAQIAAGRLDFTTDIGRALAGAAIVIVAVGTPSRPDGSSNLSELQAAMSVLGRELAGHRATLVLRSTIPPGTSDTLALALPSGVDLIYCPEFLREGSALPDFFAPDRTVIGAESEQAALAYYRLVEPLGAPVLITSRIEAELIKGWANAFLAMKISFANEVANLCGVLNADAPAVLSGVGQDRRIGAAFLAPGIGYGGPCFDKDVKSMAFVARQSNCPSALLAATLTVNELQPRLIVDALEQELGSLDGARIGVWGLAFKAGTDDVRNSLAFDILADLGRRGATGTAYDPAVSHADLPAGFALVRTAAEAADADALLILTEWPEFGSIEPRVLLASLRRRVVVDGRNVLDPQRIAATGLRYRGVGRSAGAPPDAMDVAS